MYIPIGKVIAVQKNATESVKAGLFEAPKIFERFGCFLSYESQYIYALLIWVG